MRYSLYCVQGLLKGQEIALKDELIIGRDPSAVGLLLKDPTVSRVHAKIYATDEGVVLQDLNSSNGTFLLSDTGELRLVQASSLLRVGNRFSIGLETQSIFELCSKMDEPLPAPPQISATPVEVPTVPVTPVPKSSPPLPTPPVFSGDNEGSIFQTNDSIVITEDILADRSTRLKAFLLDFLISFLVALVPSFLIATEIAQLLGVLLLFVGMLALLYFNGLYLYRRGQTIGKKIMGIYVADLNGRKASLFSLIVMRGLVMGLLCAIPLVGQVVGITNIAFIFRKDRRMLHDILAKTVVLKCKNEL